MFVFNLHLAANSILHFQVVNIAEAIELRLNRPNVDFQETPNASELVYTARLKAPEGSFLFCNVHVLELNQNSTSFASCKRPLL